MVGFSKTGKGWEVSLHPHVQARSAAQLACWPMGNNDYLPGNKAADVWSWLLTWI